MSDLPLLINKNSLGGLAAKETEQFFKPRTRVDVVYTISLIFWWIFFSDLVLHLTFFLTILLIIAGTPIYMALFGEKKSATSSMNKAVKLLFFYIIIQVTFPAKLIFPEFRNLFQTSFDEFERLVVVLLIPVVILLRNLSINSLEFGYFVYIRNILRGLWGSLLVTFVFRKINLLNLTGINPLFFDLVLLIALFSYILSSLLPIKSTTNEINLITIFEQYEIFQHPIERIRDHLFTAGFIIILFLMLGWVSGVNTTFFSYLTAICLFIGITLIFTSKNDTKEKNSNMQLSKASPYVTKELMNLSNTIKDLEFREPKKVYSVTDSDVPLAVKGSTNIVAEEGSVAIPTAITDKGTALVVVGKTRIESKKRNEGFKTEKVDGTTTVWLNPREWEKVESQLAVEDMVEISDETLTKVGVKNKDELIVRSKAAIEKMKSWGGSQDEFNSVLAPKSSKFSIQDTKDYSLVKLPGIHIFETKNVEMVKLFGGMVKIIDIKDQNSSYFQLFGGLITIIENKDYSFIKTPIISVIETPEGEVLRLLGLDIREGANIDPIEFSKKISLGIQKFDLLFERDPLLLFAQSEDGEIGLLLNEGEIVTEAINPPKEKIETIQGQVTKKDTIPADILNERNPDIESELQRINKSIYLIDDKLVNGEISEAKHTEVLERLIERKNKLLKKTNNTD